MNRRGQTLVEAALFMSFFTFILATLVCFTTWFLVREKLLAGVREAAFLYSGGHVSVPETEQRVRTFLARGWPRLEGSPLRVIIRRDTHWGRLFHLDVIRLTYRPQALFGRYFTKEIQEQCVIKHMPDYGVPFVGPAVRWDAAPPCGADC
jgi:hypothetical protein